MRLGQLHAVPGDLNRVETHHDSSRTPENVDGRVIDLQ